MASTGSVPLASMGIDAPLACLSRKPRSFFDYFFQLFAQVTNPPIGRFARAHGHLDGALPGQPRQPPRGLAERLPAHPARCPGAHRRGARRHRAYRPHRLRHAALPRGLSARRRRGRAQAGARGPLPKGRRGRARGCEHRRALQPRRGGRGAHPIASGHERRAPPPHRPRPAHLCRPRGRKRRRRVRARRGGARGLLGERRRPLHAHEQIRALADRGALRDRAGGALTAAEGIANYDRALVAGMVSIMSKMGISTAQGYHSAQIFEAVGLSEEVIDRYFRGTVSRVGGLDTEGIERELDERYDDALPRRRRARARRGSPRSASRSGAPRAARSTSSTPRPSTSCRQGRAHGRLRALRALQRSPRQAGARRAPARPARLRRRPGARPCRSRRSSRRRASSCTSTPAP